MTIAFIVLRFNQFEMLFSKHKNPNLNLLTKMLKKKHTSIKPFNARPISLQFSGQICFSME